MTDESCVQIIIGKSNDVIARKILCNKGTIAPVHKENSNCNSIIGPSTLLAKNV